jgi:hypothetical protein
MTSRKRGQSVASSTWKDGKELETEKPWMSMKEICEKAAHIFEVTYFLVFSFF